MLIISKDFTINQDFFRRARILLSIMFPNLWAATTILFVFLFVLSVLDQVITYYVGIIASEFYVVLGNRDFDEFRFLSVKSMLVVLAKSLSLSTISYTTSLLHVHWRRLLGQKLHSLYYSNNIFYRLNVLETQITIDNPDQRLTQDLDKMCRLFSNIFWPMIIYPFVVGYYTYTTYSSSGYLGPLVIYLYFVVGTVINRFVMNPVVRLTVLQEKKEGDFRYKHMAVRSHSEAIAFFGSGPLETWMTNASLGSLLDTQSNLIQWQYGLTLCVNAFNYIGSILSYLILGFAVFNLKKYDQEDAVTLSSVLSRNSFFYMYLINAFSRLIQLSQDFSSMAGNLHRVGECLECMRDMLKQKKDFQPRGGSSCSSTPDRITPDDSKEELINDKQFDSDSANRFAPDQLAVSLQDTMYQSNGRSEVRKKLNGVFSVQDVSYYVPDTGNNLRKQLLAAHLNLVIDQQKSILITGDSSAGKTSFFRILRGLWTPSSGHVDCNISIRPNTVMFLPQKSYFPIGSLRQQIVYPARADFTRFGDQPAHLLKLLNLVDLGNLVERSGGWDKVVDWNWHEVLSPGEMQRLSFCRLLYHKPLLAFLDESTSSVGLDMERNLYSLLPQYGISYVSIGHRMSLKQFHAFELHLDGAGGSDPPGTWVFRPLSKASSNLFLDTVQEKF